MRGRKCKENSYNSTISIKVTEKQKEVLNENEEIREQLKKDIRAYLNRFIQYYEIKNKLDIIPINLHVLNNHLNYTMYNGIN